MESWKARWCARSAGARGQAKVDTVSMPAAFRQGNIATTATARARVPSAMAPLLVYWRDVTRAPLVACACVAAPGNIFPRPLLVTSCSRAVYMIVR
jgi:hypothetical protein